MKQHKKELQDRAAFMDLARSGGDFTVEVGGAETKEDEVSCPIALRNQDSIPKITLLNFCHRSNCARCYTMPEVTFEVCNYC